MHARTHAHTHSLQQVTDALPDDGRPARTSEEVTECDTLHGELVTHTHACIRTHACTYTCTHTHTHSSR